MSESNNDRYEDQSFLSKNKGLLRDCEERPKPGAALQRAKVWAPLRSVASWYLWRLTDGGEV